MLFCINPPEGGGRAVARRSGRANHRYFALQNTGSHGGGVCPQRYSQTHRSTPVMSFPHLPCGLAHQHCTRETWQGWAPFAQSINRSSGHLLACHKHAAIAGIKMTGRLSTSIRDSAFDVRASAQPSVTYSKVESEPEPPALTHSLAAGNCRISAPTQPTSIAQIVPKPRRAGASFTTT